MKATCLCPIHFRAYKVSLGEGRGASAAKTAVRDKQKERRMFLHSVLVAICIALMGYLSVQLYALNARLREQARTKAMREAMDWTKPETRRRSSVPA